MDFKAQFQRKELELDAILEITEAINNNMPEESLYMMYKFTLRGTLQLEKLALFVWDKEWACRVNFGTSFNFSHFPLEQKALTNIKTLTYTKDILFEEKKFQEFQIVIPVFHKNNILAYLFFNPNPNETQENTEIDTRLIETLTNVILVAIENKKLVREQIAQAGLQREMEIAQQVQSLLFPKKLPFNKKIKIKATYYPHHLIGGDYYDYIAIDNNKHLWCIADVSGKGVPAALLMSNFQASLQTLVRQTTQLRAIVEALNHSIYRNAQGEHFITFFIAIYDSEVQNLTYINAGHNPPILFDLHTHHTHILDTGTTVLGVFEPLPFLQETTMNSLKNFYLFHFTDGVTELNNLAGEQFGDDRLLDFLKNNKHTNLSDIHEALIQKMNDFRQNVPYTDDVTLLSCRIDNEIH